MDGRTPSYRASVLAAAPAGALILLVFFVWHWLTIAPVWAPLLEGAIGVALASLAVGWAWMRSRAAGRFAGPWGGLAFGAVFAGAVLVGELLGLAHGPWPEPTTLAEGLSILPWALAPVVLVAIAGARLAGGWKGALAFALAALVLVLYLGGSVVQRGGVGLGLGLFWILFPGYLAAGVIVGWLEPRLARVTSRRGASPAA